MTLKVVAVACLDKNSKVWSLPKPARHHNVLHLMFSKKVQEKDSSDSQGFLLNDGSYVDRKGYVYCH